MRRLLLPSVLVAVPMTFGCSSEAPADASIDAIVDLVDTGADRADAGADIPSDLAADVVDVDVADAAPPLDDGPALDDGPSMDIEFSDRREVSIPDGAPTPVCEGARNDAGMVSCREENVQGTGLFCIRYLCGADDGGTTLDGCCRLVG